MNSSDELMTPKRSTRKRATRAVRSTAGRTRATRGVDTSERVEKRVKPKPVATSTKVTNTAAETRKAPTSLASRKAAKKHQRKRQIIIVILLLIGLGSSAAVGLTDSGQIDVKKTIEARNERIKNNQALEIDTLVTDTVIPVQNTNKNREAGNGLVGLGKPNTTSEPTLEPDIASSTATSTEATASSTTEVISETTESELNEETNSDTEPVVEEEDETAI